MKKWTIAAVALAAGLYATAQETGMHFEHGGTWEQALAKAKAENKYIFIDCYTTWCGPCKQMSKNVFPTAAVGDFYNKNFINLKVQIDTLKDKDKKIIDSKDVQDWYATADMLEATYNVKAYPTYLFFDPKGQIVHRAVGSSEADKFISKGQEAINPQTQYYALKRKFESGAGMDETLLHTLTKAANDNYDQPFAKTVAAKYLAGQKDLLTKENILFMYDNIKSSSDIGFTELRNHPEAFDSIIGKGYAKYAFRDIINQEEAMPLVAANEQQVPTTADWEKALKNASAKYPAEAPEAIAFYKIAYYEKKRDWKNFGPAVTSYMKSFGSSATPMQMNNFAWSIFQNCNDMACVTSALEWSKKSFDGTNTPTFMDTYANLLYKSGKKKEAIEWETKAIAFAEKGHEDVGEYQENLNKMKKGEKTW